MCDTEGLCLSSGDINRLMMMNDQLLARVIITPGCERGPRRSDPGRVFVWWNVLKHVPYVFMCLSVCIYKWIKTYKPTLVDKTYKVFFKASDIRIITKLTNIVVGTT
jgi:hypothetical protein